MLNSGWHSGLRTYCWLPCLPHLSLSPSIQHSQSEASSVYYGGTSAEVSGGLSPDPGLWMSVLPPPSSFPSCLPRLGVLVHWTSVVSGLCLMYCPIHPPFFAYKATSLLPADWTFKVELPSDTQCITVLTQRSSVRLCQCLSCQFAHSGHCGRFT